MRLNQASETLHESQVLLEQNSPRGAINRAYYAMFYALCR
ncbi:MAG: HEPN domain-containing protein [Nitrospirae bacterium]|nr:HEPN domain-containing protein [Nitrospirota bacterium]